MKSIDFLALLVAAVWLTGCERQAKKNTDPLPGMESNQATTQKKSEPGTGGLAQVNLPPDSPQLQRIRTALAETADVPMQEIIAPGKVEMNPSRVSKMAMPVAGRVREVLVGLGDSVRKGQPLLTVDSPDVGAALSAYRQAEANIAQSKASLAKAEADLARVQDLLANRAIAGKEVVAAETVVAQSRAQVDQAQAASDDAHHRLDVFGLKTGSFQQQIVVPATVSGKVIDLSIVPGEYRTDTSAPIITVADLSTVWVAADVPEAAIRYVHTGDRVAIQFGAYPDETFSARVMRIADIVDPQSRTIKVRAELPNPNGRFRPDMFAQMRQSQGTESLPVVPRGAVLEAEGRNTVYIERSKGSFQEVPVTVAWQQGDRIALRTGVRAGDRVVVEGAVLLKGY